MRLALTAGWQTAEASPVKPSVADEFEHVGFYLSDVLYRVLPVFYEVFEDALREAYGEATPAAGRARLRLLGRRRHGRQSQRRRRHHRREPGRPAQAGARRVPAGRRRAGRTAEPVAGPRRRRRRRAGAHRGVPLPAAQGRRGVAAAPCRHAVPQPARADRRAPARDRRGPCPRLSGCGGVPGRHRR